MWLTNPTSTIGAALTVYARRGGAVTFHNHIRWPAPTPQQPPLARRLRLELLNIATEADHVVITFTTDQRIATTYNRDGWPATPQHRTPPVHNPDNKSTRRTHALGSAVRSPRRTMRRRPHRCTNRTHHLNPSAAYCTDTNSGSATSRHLPEAGKENFIQMKY